MALRLVTPPAADPVSVAETEVEARVTALDDKVRLASYLDAAVADVEAMTGRALISQQWDLLLCEFDPVIWVPKPPLVSVDSITYRDPTGASVVLAAAAYHVRIESGDAPGKAAIVPAASSYWPTIGWHPEAVVVRFTAGYGVAAEDVPAALRVAIGKRMAQYFDGVLDDQALYQLLGRYVLTELA